MNPYLKNNVRERTECSPCKTQTKAMIVTATVLIILCAYLVNNNNSPNNIVCLPW